MRYDREETSRRVTEKRERFIKTIVLLALFLASAIIVLIVYPETTVTFVCAISIIALSVSILVTLKKYELPILFGKEIVGINAKEHEYAVSGRARTSRWFGRYTLGSGRITKSNIHSIIYLRLDDGDVIAVDGHMKAHTDIYEIGDRLVRYEGTKYLVIDSGEAKKNPCPICGTINDGARIRCDGCGLGIIKNN